MPRIASRATRALNSLLKRLRDVSLTTCFFLRQATRLIQCPEIGVHYTNCQYRLASSGWQQSLVRLPEVSAEPVVCNENPGLSASMNGSSIKFAPPSMLSWSGHFFAIRESALPMSWPVAFRRLDVIPEKKRRECGVPINIICTLYVVAQT